MRQMIIIHGNTREPLRRLPGRFGQRIYWWAERVGICLVLVGILSACVGMRAPERAVTLEDIYRPPRILPRHGWVQAQPWGKFRNQIPTKITLLDAGNQVKGLEDLLQRANQRAPVKSVPEAGQKSEALLSYSYVRVWNNLIGPNGYQDVPVHFIVDQAGIIWAGRDPALQGEIYERGHFSRLYQQPEAAKNEPARVAKRFWGQRLDLDGHLLVLVVGDFESDVLTDVQEAVTLQLLNHLCQEYTISPNNIGLLSDAFQSSQNPGMYLRNYVESGILTKLINEPIPRGETDSFSLFERPHQRR